MRAALLLVLVLAACGGSATADSPLAHRVEHLEEHGFDVEEVAPDGDPMPDAMAVVQLDGATATIYAYGSEADALRATSGFAAEEQAAPDRVRVQREGANVYVARAPGAGGSRRPTSRTSSSLPRRSTSGPWLGGPGTVGSPLRAAPFGGTAMRTRNQVPFFVSAAMGGAAMAYFLDPQNGRRRRHQSRDQLVSLVRQGTKRGRKLVRHATSDAAGQARRAAHAIRPSGEVELDDATLVDKVESIVFRNHDLPKGQININAENGVVFLRGQVERSELVEALEKRVRKVNGVKDVENLLNTPETGPRES